MTDRQKTSTRGPGAREVAGRLRDLITHDEIAPGHLLPTEMALAERLEVPRTTISTALKILAREGRVTKAKRGNRVAPIDNPIRRVFPGRYQKGSRDALLPDGTRAKGAFHAEVTAAGYIPTWEVIESIEQATPDVATLLGISARGRVLVRRREMFAARPESPEDRIPVQIATSYVLAEIALAADLSAEESVPGGMISALAATDFAQQHVTETLTAREPTDDEVRFFRLVEGQSVYDVAHVGTTGQSEESDPVVVEYTRHIMPTHLWTLVHTAEIDQ